MGSDPDHGSLVDLLEDDRTSPMDQLEQALRSEQLAELLSSAGLSEREATVVQARHSEEHTPYQQLADRFGISRERTRQLEHNALRKLRHCAEAQTAAA